MRVATYLRVSTGLQTVENQRLEIERHVTARGWTMFKEFADEGASGATTRRAALDQLMADARRRRFDVVCVAKLDRFRRSLKGLVAQDCVGFHARLQVQNSQRIFQIGRVNKREIPISPLFQIHGH